MLLNQGVQAQILEETTTGAGVTERIFSIQSSSVLATLSISSIASTLDISVLARVGIVDTPIITFPQQSGPTAQLLIERAGLPVTAVLVVRATYAGACSYEVQCRAVEDHGKVSIHDENGDPFTALNPLPIAGTVTISGPPGVLSTVYSNVSSVGSSVLTTMQTYVTPATGNTYLQKVDASGTNIAEYTLEIDSVVMDKKRTYFGSALNIDFLFSETTSGLLLTPGSVVVLKVIHSRPFVGDFNSRIQTFES